MRKSAKVNTPPSDMSAFQKTLSASKHIIAVAGAGLSAASGIPTFRGDGGWWRKHNAMALATPEAFGENPSRVWQFYHYRREKALNAQPNAAHLALAMLSVESIRNKLSPGSTFTLITQNVDGLSPRAYRSVLASLDPPQAESANGQPSLIEMHGRLSDLQCWSEDCGHVETVTVSPICEALGGTENWIEGDGEEQDIPVEKLPRCSKCGSLARPGVVWFGEALPEVVEIESLVEKADLCLVVGTSSTVYPAAGYASGVQENGGKVAVFNLDRSSGDEDADFLFLGPCEETLPQALGLAAS